VPATAGIKQILVAVKELSGHSLPAVLKAAQIARACGAGVELFHGLTAPVYFDIYTGGAQGVRGVEWELRQHALRRLEAIADRLRQHSIKVTVAAEWDFPAYEAVVRRAQRIKADLIVASRFAGRHAAPWLLRLTDWELLRLSPIPVLLVKNTHAYRHPAVLAAVDPTHAAEKPLQLDREILRLASTISAGLRGTLHAVHAYARVPVEELPSVGISPHILKKIEQGAERAARVGFDKVLEGTQIARSRRYLLARHPVDAIRDAARRSKSGIVVMGAVSRSGIKRLLIGNTAERILDELGCDVLVVKPQGFPNRVPRAARGARVVMDTPAGMLGYY
jgi:universal stress protein E